MKYKVTNREAVGKIARREPFNGEWEWEVFAEVSGPALARGHEFSLPSALDALFRRLAQGVGGK